MDDDPVRSKFVAGGRGRGNTPPEEDLWVGSYSPKAMAGATIAAGLFTLLGMILATFAGPPGWAALIVAAIVVWCGLALVYFYRRLTVHYRLSTYRFFHDKGLLSRTGNRVEVIDVDDVTVKQGPIDRLFGVGTISIRSSDTTDPELRLPGIENVRAVADLIDGTRRAERQRRGMFMENV
jgi:membrane protein YdbS with pleckstrin-like domain